MDILHINFLDFWKEFDKTNNYFYNLLSEKYQIVIDENTPELIFYSCFGNDHFNYSCKKIFYTGENIRPNFLICDFAFSFDYNSRKNHFRLPLYSLYIEHHNMLDKLRIKRNDDEWKKIWSSKEKFCCMVVSNPDAYERINFFKKLSLTKKVDSGGSVLNNIGGRVKDKMEFISNYKFVMSFENESHSGYTTEKILEPIVMDSIPIYWGNKKVHLDFNPKRFINYHDFKTEEDLFKKLDEIENNPVLALEILKEPIFALNKVDFEKERSQVLNEIIKIYKSDKKPKAKTYWAYIYNLKLKIHKFKKILKSLI